MKVFNSLRPKQQLNKIVGDGMCIGCGLCESVIGQDVIRLEVDKNGFESPVVGNPFDQISMNRIVQVCPATRVSGLPEHLVSEEAQSDLIWGEWHEIYYAYAVQEDVRHQASTGGLLTGLALYLLESGTVDFVLHAKAAVENPSFGEATISRTRKDVLSAMGSRYGPTATLKQIVQTIDKAKLAGETFAFIGTPCDVSALRNYAEINSTVDTTCHVMLTMVCGGFMSPFAFKEYMQALGIDATQIKSIRYRGYGCPGPTVITMQDGSVREITYLEFWGEDDSMWQLPLRCKVCPDGIGDAADIAASDTWAGGSPTLEQQESDLGTNAAIVRTSRGVELMDKAIAAGYLNQGRDLTPEDLSAFQPHQVAKKKSVWARFQGMQAAGNVVPETKRLRLRQLWQNNDPEFNRTETDGAKLRARRQTSS